MSQETPQLPEPSVLENEGAQLAAPPQPSDRDGIPSHPDLVLDKDKAADMEYAARPHTKDALALRDVAEHAKSVLSELSQEQGRIIQKMQTDHSRELDVKAEWNNRDIAAQSQHVTSLDKAKNREETLADRATKKAAQEYDSAP